MTLHTVVAAIDRRALLATLLVMLLPIALPPVRAEGEFQLKRVVTLPEGFRGNVAFDRESARLFLISHGPPANSKGPSTLYELDRQTGRAIRRRVLPFLGELPGTVVIGGVLFVGVPFESKVYKVELTETAEFGAILGTLRIPDLTELGPTDKDDVFRFPFLGFQQLAAAEGGDLLVYSDALGSLLSLSIKDGSLVRRIDAAKGLMGLAHASENGSAPLLIANSNPSIVQYEREARRFQYRADHGSAAQIRYGAKEVLWMLLDASSGIVLASHDDPDSRIDAGTIAWTGHATREGSRYGKLSFYAVGQEGLFEVEWTPGGSTAGAPAAGEPSPAAVTDELAHCH